MSSPSDEIKIPPSLARELIESQFPSLGPIEKIELAGRGYDNAVYVVNQQWIFRFPKRQLSVPLLEWERKLLPQISAHLPLPIPAPQWVGIPTTTYPFPFWGCPYIQGETFYSHRLSGDERALFAPEIASFLEKLHSLDTNLLSLTTFPEDSFGKFNAEIRVPQIVENLNRLEKLGETFPWKKAKDLAQRIFHAPEPAKRSLVHGDLHGANMLHLHRTKLTAILDWGDSHFGDPSGDLYLAWSFFPPKGRESFWKNYGPIDEVTYLRSRWKALSTNVILLCRGHEDQREELIEIHRRGLEWALSD